LLREAEVLGLLAASIDAGIVGVEKNRDLNALIPRPAERSGVVEPLGPGVYKDVIEGAFKAPPEVEAEEAGMREDDEWDDLSVGTESLVTDEYGLSCSPSGTDSSGVGAAAPRWML
jgi:hypothetical protein